MDPVEVRIKLSDKAIRGLLEVIRGTSIKVANLDVSRNDILKTLRGDLAALCLDLEEYEKKIYHLKFTFSYL